MTRLTVILATTCLILLGTPPAPAATSAQAEKRPRWGSPRYLSDGAPVPLGAQVSADTKGNLVAVWAYSDGGTTEIQSSRKLLGGSWTPPVRLSRAGLESASPTVAMDARGTIVAAWVEHDGTDQRITVSRKQRSGPWSSPFMISGPGSDSGTPVVTFSGTTATLAWRVLDAQGRYHVRLSRFPAREWWTMPRDIAEGESISGLDMVGDRRNEVTVVWSEVVNGVRRVRSRHRNRSGYWPPAKSLSNPGGDAAQVDLGLDGKRRVVAVWQRESGTNNRIQVSRRAVSGAWSLPISVTRGSENSTRPSVGVSRSGEITIAFEAADAVRVVNSKDDGTWSKARSLASSAANPQVVRDQKGLGTVLWQKTVGSRVVVQSVRRALNGRWSPVKSLSSSAGTASGITLAVDRRGRVTAVWSVDRGSYRVQTRTLK